MRYRLVYLGIFASVLLGACSENDILKGEPGYQQELQFEASIHQNYVTRANDAGFAVGDAIGVYVVDYENGAPRALASSGNHADNVKYTLGNDGWSSVTRLYWNDNTTPVDAYSYYPFMESVGDITSIPFVIEHRQDTDATGKTLGGYEKSDFLWAQATASQPLTPIALHHHHVMAGIQLSLIEGEGFDGEWSSLDKAVTVTNTILGSHINLQTGQVTVDDAETPEPIIPYRNGSDWRCVVVHRPLTLAKT